MYIWILLATIIVSLSFFNLSPRQDKEAVVPEVKAISFVSRFRIEHEAFAESAKCILNNSTTSPASSTPIPSSDPASETEAESKSNINSYDMKTCTTECFDILYKDALPIGYKSGVDLNTKHFAFCVDNKIEGESTPGLVACSASNYRYAVSVAEVPHRWLTKNDASPASHLTTALTRLYAKRAIIGTMACNVDGKKSSGCTFSSYMDDPQSKRPTLEPQEGGFYSDLYKNENFVNSCSSAPCLFAITKVANNGKGCSTTTEP